MKSLTSFAFASTLLLQVLSTESSRRTLEEEDVDRQRTIEDCLLKDSEHVSSGTIDALDDIEIGNWIDDAEVLLEEWSPGMGVRAVNYCTNDEDGSFLSMQLMVGDSKEEDIGEWSGLRKHGAAGGSCYRWQLNPEDYIRRV